MEFWYDEQIVRKVRLEYGGAIYHLMSRSDRRKPIFKDHIDRRRFLETLTEACLKTGWGVHVYCLMSNHFHLVVETPQPNLVVGMKWFLGTYTGRFNRRHRLFGHLFSGRYKCLIVDGSGNEYLRAVGDYVHLNPVRAKLVGAEAALRTFVWSSYAGYLKGGGSGSTTQDRSAKTAAGGPTASGNAHDAEMDCQQAAGWDLEKPESPTL